MVLVKVVHVDIDNDGAQETMALINCVSGEIGEMAVIGFDRDAAGAIVTMGLAVSSEIDGSKKGMPEEIADVRSPATPSRRSSATSRSAARRTRSR